MVWSSPYLEDSWCYQQFTLLETNRFSHPSIRFSISTHANASEEVSILSPIRKTTTDARLLWRWEKSLQITDHWHWNGCEVTKGRVWSSLLSIADQIDIEETRRQTGDTLICAKYIARITSLCIWLRLACLQSLQICTNKFAVWAISRAPFWSTDQQIRKFCIVNVFQVWHFWLPAWSKIQSRE